METVTLTLLLILNLQIVNNEVTFLTNQFAYSRIECFNKELKEVPVIIDRDSVEWTGHSFIIPTYLMNGDYECIISVWGDGYIFPSQWDMASKHFNIIINK